MKRLLLPLLILVLVLVVASLSLGACGSSTSDEAKALVTKQAAVWAGKDTVGAREIYTDDAVVYMPTGSGDTNKISGIDEILTGVRNGIDNKPYGDALTLSVPADEKALAPGFRGATYVTQAAIVKAGPLSLPFTVTIEVRDGKIVNQWIMQMYRD